MQRETLWAQWAPPSSPWSVWAKPVLFAQMPSDLLAAESAPAPAVEPALASLPAASSTHVLVLDLPEAAAVYAGLALARRGWRPVPLFNTSIGPSPVLDVTPIARALVTGAPALAAVPDDAPPAFLLDSRRTSEAAAAVPGRYDNRWVVFPQDFPSANFLLARGAQRAIVVGAAVPDDLAHVLLRWQQAGLVLLRLEPGASDAPAPLVVGPPSLFRRAWHRLRAVSGLQRNAAGGFGASIPLVTSSGG